MIDIWKLFTQKLQIPGLDSALSSCLDFFPRSLSPLQGLILASIICICTSWQVFQCWAYGVQRITVAASFTPGLSFVVGATRGPGSLANFAGFPCAESPAFCPPKPVIECTYCYPWAETVRWRPSCYSLLKGLLRLIHWSVVCLRAGDPVRYTP